MTNVDVKKVRQNLGMTQPEFALRFGFNLYTLRQWEQDRRAPSQSTCVLLKVIARAPAVVEEAIRAA